MPEEFFKVDVHFLDHPRLSGLSGDAMTLFWACVAYANRLWTDGFVPEAYVNQLVQAFPGLGELVERELLVAVNGGYEIRNYLEHNRSRADRDKQRQDWKDRQARHRTVTRDSRVSHRRVTRQEVEVEVEKEVDQEQGQTLSSTGEQSTSRQQEQRVYTAWLASLPPGISRQFTEPRRKAVRARLVEHPIEDAIDAARGWVNDPWDGRAEQNDLAILMRPSNFERMRDYARNGRPRQMGKQTTRAAAVATAMLERGPDGMGRVGRDRGEAQQQLPRPGDRGPDGGGVVRGAPRLPGG